MITKTIPGPVFKLDNSIPCGCKISRDDDTKRLRLWYCLPHAAAFEVLDALRSNADALDRAIKQAPPANAGVDFEETTQRARIAIRKATVGV